MDRVRRTANTCLTTDKKERGGTTCLLKLSEVERNELVSVVCHDRVPVPWLTLPVVMTLSHRRSHACVSASLVEVKPQVAH